jgi:hypothetical protein
MSRQWRCVRVGLYVGRTASCDRAHAETKVQMFDREHGMEQYDLVLLALALRFVYHLGSLVHVVQGSNYCSILLEMNLSVRLFVHFLVQLRNACG